MSLLEGWTPFRAGWVDGQMTVDWCHLGGHRFTEPFFYETIARAIGYPFNTAFRQRTLADTLGTLSPGLPPAGFIFHMARCGSTLAAQALAADPANVVASEAGPVRAMLQAPRDATLEPGRVDRWLAGIVNALARPRFPGERRLFVKFMAADVLDLPRIQRVFPGVPWLFLYRDPLEILTSQRRLGGADTLPGAIPPERLGLDATDPWTLPSEIYQLRVLAAFGQAALDGLDRAPAHGLVLRYDDLPAALFDRIPAHFGFAPDAALRDAIARVARRNAKAPGATFVPDEADKQREATAWRAAAGTLTGPVFAALDAARHSA